VRERIFYDDEGRAPEESAEDQGEVGFDGGGSDIGGGGVDVDSTL
jgi:hypothetical protein